jgi:hypothetical protein
MLPQCGIGYTHFQIKKCPFFPFISVINFLMETDDTTNIHPDRGANNCDGL